MPTPNRALIVVDVQQEYFAGPLEIQYPSVDDSLARVAEAIDAASAAGIPVVVFQHTSGEGSPVFDPSTEAFALHPEIERRRRSDWKSITKRYSSVFADTDLLDWLHENSLDTVTLVGYMTNNCILASAAGAEAVGITAEVLSDATGAISLGNDAGHVDAETVHRTLMALLDSNFAAVATTTRWTTAVSAGQPLAASNLPESATAGAARFPRG